MSWLRRNLVLLLGLLVLVYTFIPIFVVVLMSFNAPASRLSFTFDGFTWDNWLNPCQPSGMCESLVKSLQIGFLSTVFATLLGTLAALSLGGPASAHVGGGAAGSDFDGRVTSVTPHVPGLHVRVLQFGDELEVVNDSELVARQIGGEYKVKHAGLKPLFVKAMAELRGFDSWAVRSVRREHNERADELVNEALDRALG